MKFLLRFLVFLGLSLSSYSAFPCSPTKQIAIKHSSLNDLDITKLVLSSLSDGEFLLTFDDGPVLGSTNLISDVLKDNCVTAVFFHIGSRVEKNQALVSSLLSNGNIIGSHSFFHRDLSKLSFLDAASDISRGLDSVRAYSSGSPILFRFPFFRKNPELVKFIEQNKAIILNANISPQDWRGDDYLLVYDRLIDLMIINKKGIVVLHDNNKQTFLLLRKLLQNSDRDFRFVSLIISD